MQIIPDFADIFGAALSRTNVEFGLRRTIPTDRISTYSTCACVKLRASEMWIRLELSTWHFLKLQKMRQNETRAIGIRIRKYV